MKRERIVQAIEAGSVGAMKNWRYIAFAYRSSRDVHFPFAALRAARLA